MLRYLTAGESHGKGILALVDGFPAGIRIDSDLIDAELRRRQGGYGRGNRQRIETDSAEILTGIWNGTSLGSPIALWVVNQDYKMERMEDLDRPRPGHGDLSGSIKYHGPIRAILERASARETAGRVAAGALAKQILLPFEIQVFGYVVELGGVKIEPQPGTLEQQRKIRDASELYGLGTQSDEEIKALVHRCQKEGDTLGGVLEVRVEGVPFGLGTHSQWDLKLDGRLAQAVMAVQAMKGVEIGLGFEASRRRGSKVHDPIKFDPSRVDSHTLGFERPTNNAGGIEAGMTNSQPIVIRAAKKPISTLARPLESVNLKTKQPDEASYERSDICAVPAASVVLENVVAFEVARAMTEQFGGNSIDQMRANWETFHKMARDGG